MSLEYRPKRTCARPITTAYRKRATPLADNLLPDQTPELGPAERMQREMNMDTVRENMTTQKGESCRDILTRHRRVWSRKPSLRRVYETYFRTILEQCGTRRPIVELGSGPGFFKEFAPHAIATDVESTPWIDLVVDACELPFADESVGNIVMLDVFHHIARPAKFLEEAARVLKLGGRIIMLEPWTSPLGYLFYRYIHHEGADRRVNPLAPFRDKKAAFDGNAAVPRLYFDCRERFGPLVGHDDRLRISSVRLLPAMSWLLSGGFRPYGLLPAPLLPLARGIDRLLLPIARLFALRALIVVERTGSVVKVHTTQDVLHVPFGAFVAAAFEERRPT